MKSCKPFSDLEMNILEHSINYTDSELLDNLEKKLSLLSDFFTVV